MQSLVDKLVACNPLIASITYKATEKTKGETEKTKGQSSLTSLDSLVAFGREAPDLYLFAARSADVSFMLRSDTVMTAGWPGLEAESVSWSINY